MPITCVTFLIATLAIAGFPGLSGFYSKDAILGSALGAVWAKGHWVLFILPALAAAITAFYMMRVYLLTFHTTAKDEHIYHHAHESPKLMWVPLALLAALTIGIGWFGQVPERKALGHGEYAYEAMASGFLLAIAMYLLGWISAARTAERFKPLYNLLVNKFYFDELYQATFVAGVLKLAAFGKWFDKTILDGIADGSARWVVNTAFFSGRTLDNRGVDGAVNGAASLALAGGNLARKGQNGRVRNYILAMTSVVAVVILVSAYFFFDWVK
jgi:NADH-quinone oxidoreductase subunit L